MRWGPLGPGPGGMGWVRAASVGLCIDGTGVLACGNGRFFGPTGVGVSMRAFGGREAYVSFAVHYHAGLWKQGSVCVDFEHRCANNE